jgi:hypothetical protein
MAQVLAMDGSHLFMQFLNLYFLAIAISSSLVDKNAMLVVSLDAPSGPGLKGDRCFGSTLPTHPIKKISHLVNRQGGRKRFNRWGILNIESASHSMRGAFYITFSFN